MTGLRPTTAKFSRLVGTWLPALAAGALPFSGHAAENVDWLTFSPTATRTVFSLLGDSGQTVLSAQIALTAGTLAPLSPGGNVLQSAFWSPAPAFDDSVSGTATIATTRVQVAPQAGAVNYRLTLQGADLSGLTFAIGQLFGSGAAGTRQVNITAKTAAAVPVAPGFLGLHAWDNGLKFYTQPLAWNGAAVSLAAGLDGESSFAFFRIPANAAPVTELVFDVPQGYASGSGDALEFAFGIPAAAPEPGVAGLLLAGCVGMGFTRRRSPRR